MAGRHDAELRRGHAAGHHQASLCIERVDERERLLQQCVGRGRARAAINRGWQE
jgi:hypothetical protein